MESRALYNSLRMNWLLDPAGMASMEAWQVEDYRPLSLEDLFKRLKARNIDLDKPLFFKLAEECDTPEDLASLLVESDDRKIYDPIYLLLFEIWRRLVPEKQSFSVFCDELDHQIYLYDSGQAETSEGIEDTLANLKMILEENVDNGADPHELFSFVVNGCANDLEAFLYDFIQIQIDFQNEAYAQELADFFLQYVADSKWFLFLKAKALYANDREASLEIIDTLMKARNKDPDVEFNLELMEFLTKGGDEKTFKTIAKKTLSLLELEEDFIDFALICAKFFHFSDNDSKENAVQRLLKGRQTKDLEAAFLPEDPHGKELLKILSS